MDERKAGGTSRREAREGHYLIGNPEGEKAPDLSPDGA